MLYPNPTWEIDSRSNFLISHSLALSLPPQALLLSFFPELSSKRCLAFFYVMKKKAAGNIEKFIMLNKRRRWFHSSRVKLPLVNMSASWFLVSTCLIWILGSKLALSNNQSNAPLWVLDTCSHRKTSALCDHFHHSFIVFKNVQLSFELRKFVALVTT